MKFMKAVRVVQNFSLLVGTETAGALGKGFFYKISPAEFDFLSQAACIANALYDAVGVRIWRLPMTPEKVLRALREK